MKAIGGNSVGEGTVDEKLVRLFRTIQEKGIAIPEDF